MIRRMMFALVAGAALLVAAPAFAATEQVSVVDSEFEPGTVTIDAGDTVRWVSSGSLPHNVMASNGSFESGTLNDGDDYSRTFNNAGTFDYYCSFHGSASGSGMAGTVVVRAAAATAGGDDGDDVSAAGGGLAQTAQGPSAPVVVAGLSFVALGLWLMDMQRIRSARHRA